MKQKDLYWMAGIIEGEGAMYVKEKQKSAVLVIDMTDKDVVERVANLWKNKTIYTHTPKNPNGNDYKTMYKVQRKGYPALIIMQLIYPIMGDRRKKQIEKCFDLYNYNIHKKLPIKSKTDQRTTGAQIKKILTRYEQGESPYEIAKDYQFSGSHLSNICHGRRLKTIVASIKNND